MIMHTVIVHKILASFLSFLLTSFSWFSLSLDVLYMRLSCMFFFILFKWILFFFVRFQFCFDFNEHEMPVCEKSYYVKCIPSIWFFFLFDWCCLQHFVYILLPCYFLHILKILLCMLLLLLYAMFMNNCRFFIYWLLHIYFLLSLYAMDILTPCIFKCTRFVNIKRRFNNKKRRDSTQSNQPATTKI